MKRTIKDTSRKKRSKKGEVMQKVLRVGITYDEWDELESLLTHHGELSFILRKAIREYIKAKKEERDVRIDSSKRSRSKQA